MDIELKSPRITIPDVWSEEELAFFLASDAVKESPYYLALLIIATTGLSRSEACGLKWSHWNDTYFILDQGVDAYGNTQNYYQGMAKKSMHRSEVLKIEEKLFSQKNRIPLDNPLDSAR